VSSGTADELYDSAVFAPFIILRWASSRMLDDSSTSYDVLYVAEMPSALAKSLRLKYVLSLAA
jgi:hypothetical protein